MRLKREHIQTIAEAMVASLDAKKLVAFERPRTDVVKAIVEVITKDLTAEDQLNRDVEKVLTAYEAEISKGNMDYRKVFELTKQKMAKERGMVI
jgi:hypothetical protein